MKLSPCYHVWREVLVGGFLLGFLLVCRAYQEKFQTPARSMHLCQPPPNENKKSCVTGRRPTKNCGTESATPEQHSKQWGFLLNFLVNTKLMQMTACKRACQTGASARLPAYWSVIHAVARSCATSAFSCNMPVHMWLAMTCLLSLSLSFSRSREQKFWEGISGCCLARAETYRAQCTHFTQADQAKMLNSSEFSMP